MAWKKELFGIFKGLLREVFGFRRKFLRGRRSRYNGALRRILLLLWIARLVLQRLGFGGERGRGRCRLSGAVRGQDKRRSCARRAKRDQVDPLVCFLFVELRGTRK